MIKIHQGFSRYRGNKILIRTTPKHNYLLHPIGSEAEKKTEMKMSTCICVQVWGIRLMIKMGLWNKQPLTAINLLLLCKLRKNNNMQFTSFTWSNSLVRPDTWPLNFLTSLLAWSSLFWVSSRTSFTRLVSLSISFWTLSCCSCSEAFAFAFCWAVSTRSPLSCNSAWLRDWVKK